MDADEFYRELETPYLDARVDFEFRNTARYERHIEALSNLLEVMDGFYMQAIPYGFLNLRPAISSPTSDFAIMGYSIGLLIRCMQRELRI